MDDLIHQLNTILRGVWQRRWIGIGVAWLVGVIGAVVVLLTPDRFEASARIAVDTQSLLRPLMQGLTVEPNIDQQMAMLSRTLISRPNVEKLIHMAGLDDKSRAEKDALVSDVMRRLEIRTAGRDNLYILSFRDTDPARAKRVVEGFASIFVDANKGEDAKESADAKKFIEEQIQDYEKRLEQAENRLKEFRLRHLGLSEGGMDHAGRMNEVSTRLNEARLALREAENSRGPTVRFTTTTPTTIMASRKRRVTVSQAGRVHCTALLQVSTTYAEPARSLSATGSSIAPSLVLWFAWRAT